MKRQVLFIVLITSFLCGYAQDAGRTLKPNYGKIARVVGSASSPFFLDSLEARFARCDTSMTVDHFRCLYYGGPAGRLAAAHRAVDAAVRRFGMASRRAGVAWWRYQMLTAAVWSTGDGSRRKPLHVTGYDDAAVVAADFGAPLWFKIKGRCKFSAAPPR